MSPRQPHAEELAATVPAPAAGALGADGAGGLVSHDRVGDGASEPWGRRVRVALLGSPNTGKTTLFNRLTGLRHKTANFAGTTLEARSGWVALGGAPVRAAVERACGPGLARTIGAGLPESAGQGERCELIDLPGVYSLELERLESRLCRGVLAGETPWDEARSPGSGGPPEAVVVVLDSTNLARNLTLAGEALRRRLPMVVALNMHDLAVRSGLKIDACGLSERLGCPVVVTCARSGRGLDDLRAAVALVAGRGLVPTRSAPGGAGAGAAGALRQWAEGVYAEVAGGAGGGDDGASGSDRIDRVLTHPVAGGAVFVLVMGLMFMAVFRLAEYPMGWIEWVFAGVGGAVEAAAPEGLIRELLSGGVVGAIGATVVFLPQICMVVFLISLLEDTGYLARAALLMDRVLRPFGLPGHAFVPLLSAHACALPAITAARTIADRRQRVATILAAPFMTCSARIPVYVLLTGLLFPGRPVEGAAAFMGCYALGIVAGVVSALVARRTVLRGAALPMAVELPSYKVPSLGVALMTAMDRGVGFVRGAGTWILGICVVLWWLGAFPRVGPPEVALALRREAAQVRAAGVADGEVRGAGLEAQAGRLEASHARSGSYLGRMGRVFEPVFEPVGYDWRLTVGVLASFAAREVFVGTMAVIVTGEESDEVDEGLRARLSAARRDDGGELFTARASWSLLVFYVLAMQCLPTLVMTAREAGGVGWAAAQLVWMTSLAYAGALVAYHVSGWLGA